MKKTLFIFAILGLFVGSFAYAEEMKNTNATTASSINGEHMKTTGEMMRNNKAQKKMIDGACASTAVEKRENALIAGFDTFNTSIKDALNTRKVSLKEGWMKTTKSERNTTLRSGRQAFEKSSKSARTALRTVRQNAWASFKTDIKACGGTGMEEVAPSMNVEATIL